MKDLKTHAMLADMAKSICNHEAVQSATGAVMCNALTSLEHRMGALETSNINVLQEARRFNNPARPSRNRTMVTAKSQARHKRSYFGNTQNQSQRGPQRHGYREADQQNQTETVQTVLPNVL